MVKIRKRLIVLWLVFGGALISPTFAQDASLGCKVLLCAAATNPSWSGIPYCVPVMTQLFQMLRKGGGWPSCPEGNASGLGYEPYQPCPAGQASYAFNQGGADTGQPTGYVRDPDGPYCGEPERISRMCRSSQDDQGNCETGYTPAPRTQRTETNFVDITTGGSTSRFYFSLRGY